MLASKLLAYRHLAHATLNLPDLHTYIHYGTLPDPVNSQQLTPKRAACCPGLPSCIRQGLAALYSVDSISLLQCYGLGESLISRKTQPRLTVWPTGVDASQHTERVPCVSAKGS